MRHLFGGALGFSRGWKLGVYWTVSLGKLTGEGVRWQEAALTDLRCLAEGLMKDICLTDSHLHFPPNGSEIHSAQEIETRYVCIHTIQWNDTLPKQIDLLKIHVPRLWDMFCPNLKHWYVVTRKFCIIAVELEVSRTVIFESISFARKPTQMPSSGSPNSHNKLNLCQFCHTMWLEEQLCFSWLVFVLSTFALFCLIFDYP